jgi:hypothetical protein
VLCVGKDQEILRTIIRGVTVDVVNVLSYFKFPPDHVLGNDPIPRHPSTTATSYVPAILIAIKVETAVLRLAVHVVARDVLAVPTVIKRRGSLASTLTEGH